MLHGFEVHTTTARIKDLGTEFVNWNAFFVLPEYVGAAGYGLFRLRVKRGIPRGPP